MSFGPSASLHPSHCAALVGPARLRPRVARVRWTTPLRPYALTPLHPYALTPLHFSSIAPTAIHPFRFACGYPLTAAGGQGPKDNTLTPLHPYTLTPLHPYTLTPLHPYTPALLLHSSHSDSSLPLRLRAPPAYGRGWPGSEGQHPYTPALQSITPAALKAMATAPGS